MTHVNVILALTVYMHAHTFCLIFFTKPLQTMSTENNSSTVDANSSDQIEALAQELNTTVKDIKQAIKAVGTLVKDIKAFIHDLKKEHH